MYPILDDRRILETDDMPVIQLLSVNVGRPRVIGRQRGKPVTSGIAKQPIGGKQIEVGPRNLAGDQQADLKHHGSPDQAVYAYPAVHLPVWADELGQPFSPASFGENLTVSGLDEEEACVGDIWRWGDARLQITAPRYPCSKLALHNSRMDLPKRLLATGRCGWYMRVLTPGPAPVAGPIRIEARDPAGITIRRTLRTALPGADPAEIDLLLTLAPLAAGWKRMITP